ncbi:hypothetical protein [Paenibacillus pinihumi]|uniref:hypothetical protein n=1 Tax=Paenibacillus pinihumi TaxID=669462 RepID=UPI000424EC88|nr:hypothetical protein [Paenibacillus pinihumi]
MKSGKSAGKVAIVTGAPGRDRERNCSGVGVAWGKVVANYSNSREKADEVVAQTLKKREKR